MQGVLLKILHVRFVGVGVVVVALAFVAVVWGYAGTYGLNVLIRRGATTFIEVTPDDAHLSESMRLALADGSSVPPQARSVEWREISPGFETAEMPVLWQGKEVDRVLLARIDPSTYRFIVRNHPAGNREPSDWLDATDAVLVINGSYFDRRGLPDTPVRIGGQALGPSDYQAHHGAFVSEIGFTGIRDLSDEPWQVAINNASEAMVSCPLLLSPDGGNRVEADPRWLANRSFVAEDSQGRIVLGTTREAFFSLDRLATFLRNAPLDLEIALNLDGGPLACQAIRLGDYQRDFCGQWETSVHDGRLQLLRPLFGSARWGLPMILAVVPR